MADTPQIRLVPPCVEDAVSVWEFRKACLQADGGEHIAGSAGLGRAESYDAWLSEAAARTSRAITAEGTVPATVLLAKDDSSGAIVGAIDIRHALNEYLLQVGGHIGYVVHPAERGKGYATEMLKLALRRCHDLGIDRVLVTCDKSNVASARVIQANGGKLENEVENGGTIKQRYWIEL